MKPYEKIQKVPKNILFFLNFFFLDQGIHSKNTRIFQKNTRIMEHLTAVKSTPFRHQPNITWKFNNGKQQIHSNIKIRPQQRNPIINPIRPL